jgi:hypothetical protein
MSTPGEGEIVDQLSAGLKIHWKRKRASDGAMYDCAIFELNRHRLVVEFHEKSGEQNVVRVSCLSPKRMKMSASVSAHLTSFIFEYWQR